MIRKLAVSAMVRNRKGVDVKDLMRTAAARREVDMKSESVYESAAESEGFRLMLDSMSPNSASSRQRQRVRQNESASEVSTVPSNQGAFQGVASGRALAEATAQQSQEQRGYGVPPRSSSSSVSGSRHSQLLAQERMTSISSMSILEEGTADSVQPLTLERNASGEYKMDLDNIDTTSPRGEKKEMVF